uniref:SHSP domain-containing protein n=1 Tax=Syphacia muris TaxID=451379 RepID=A0A0N5AC62_9BILA
EERDEDGSKVERHFVRRYTIPETVKEDTIESQMSPDGVLTVKAKKLELQSSSRTIPIQCATGQKRPIEDAPESEKPTSKRSRKGKK